MDPVAIVGLVESSISLAVQCGSVAKKLNTLAGQFKYAKLTISTLVQNLDIMQYTWDRIGTWSKDYMPDDDAGFTQRLERFLETGSLVLEALEEDLQSYDVSNLSFGQRSRLVWNEKTLQGHQDRIRDQAQSMSFLLQAIQLPTPQATTKLLQQSEKQFMKSDESAFSIVPSDLSSRLSVSTIQTGKRNSNGSYKSLVYRRLSFEDDLFTARVYKRNYQYSTSKRVRKRVGILGAKHSNYVVQITTGPGADIPSDVIEITTGTSIEFSKAEQSTGSSTSAIDSYADLVATCGNGDNDSVSRQLGMMLASHPSDPEASPLFGSRRRDFLYFCPIYAAVFNGHVEVMKTLLRYADLEQDSGQVLEKPIGGIEDDHCRPLHVAVMRSDLSMVELLLEKGASVHSKTGSGLQALHLAAKLDSTDVFMALIDAGADMNCADPYGRKAFHYASNVDIKLYLRLKRACDVASPPLDQSLETYRSSQSKLAYKDDTTSGDEASTPDELQPDRLLQSLNTAIGCGWASFVEVLIHSGIDPNECGSDGGTGLHTFVQDFYAYTPRDISSDKKILRLLLDKVDFFAVDQSGGAFLDSILESATIFFNYRSRGLVRLCLECLPEHKSLEKDKLVSILGPWGT